MPMDNKEISKQIFEVQKKMIDKLIKKTQNEYNNSIYPEKAHNDKIICLVCGGRYFRNVKHTHDKSKKHKSKINIFYDNISNLFIEIPV